MKKKIYWAGAIGLAGLYLSTADTYWLPGTLLSDVRALTLGLFGGVLAGFSIGCIVQKVNAEGSRRLKILYWILTTGVLGCFLGFGKGVPTRNTLIVLAWTLGAGFFLGLLQYFLERPKVTTP